ncbi:helix-turn-helix transcriptional regulator [Solicola sp. PLA-1-18]|uniref:helix-turn-helix transcriptional regulator n=1 Tax=Solicola sp. PLA-1-18 TaxID=3380532 RepID=UPI003B7B1459
MAQTSGRLLTLLSLFGARRTWPGPELADRLAVSPRTLRRDVETLRDLGYPVQAVKGPDGGYRLGDGSTLPPLLLDDEQALAIAVALRTAPSSVTGIDDALARALTSVRQVMPAHLRADVDAMHLTTLRNWWEFPGPPIDASTLRAVGHAVRNAHVLRLDLLTPDGRRVDPQDPDFVEPLSVEPHHLVTWAGRWYLVAFVAVEDRWRTFRLDRVHPLAPTGRPFERRALPTPDVAASVMTEPDRGDTPAAWPCRGSVEMGLPAGVVAQYAPGGSVVERLDEGRCRLTVGAWSWAGVAGLLATFDTDLTAVEPPELVDACQVLAARFSRVATQAAPR